VGKPEGKRTYRRRKEDNIKMGLNKIRWKGVNCINLRIALNGLT
jgi:hypothetical protein